jgi:hypothetical protein
MFHAFVALQDILSMKLKFLTCHELCGSNKTLCKKIKITALRSTESIRSKTCMPNRAIKLINIFNYLGYNIPHEEEKDQTSKTVKFVIYLEFTIRP